MLVPRWQCLQDVWPWRGWCRTDEARDRQYIKERLQYLSSFHQGPVDVLISPYGIRGILATIFSGLLLKKQPRALVLKEGEEGCPYVI